MKLFTHKIRDFFLIIKLVFFPKFQPNCFFFTQELTTLWDSDELFTIRSFSFNL